MNFTKGEIDKKLLEDTILTYVMGSPSFNDNARMMMSERTLFCLAGRPFCDEAVQKYMSIQIIQNEQLSYGEIVFLTQYI